MAHPSIIPALDSVSLSSAAYASSFSHSCVLFFSTSLTDSSQSLTVSLSLCQTNQGFGNSRKSARITPTPATITPNPPEQGTTAASLPQWGRCLAAEVKFMINSSSGNCCHCCKLNPRRSWAQKKASWSHSWDFECALLCGCVCYKPFGIESSISICSHCIAVCSITSCDRNSWFTCATSAHTCGMIK